MEMNLRILTPDKEGIAKKISEAIVGAGGRIQATRVKGELRGMAETEITGAFPAESLRPAIVQSFGPVSGVAVIGPIEP